MKTFTVKTALKKWTVSAFDKADAIAIIARRADRGGLIMWAREGRH